jgi:hypothetical protein
VYEALHSVATYEVIETDNVMPCRGATMKLHATKLQNQRRARSSPKDPVESLDEKTVSNGVAILPLKLLRTIYA